MRFIAWHQLLAWWSHAGSPAIRHIATHRLHVPIRITYPTTSRLVAPKIINTFRP